jgi:hypothetical protein
MELPGAGASAKPAVGGERESSRAHWEEAMPGHAAAAISFYLLRFERLSKQGGRWPRDHPSPGHESSSDYLFPVPSVRQVDTSILVCATLVTSGHPVCDAAVGRTSCAQIARVPLDSTMDGGLGPGRATSLLCTTWQVRKRTDQSACNLPVDGHDVIARSRRAQKLDTT